MAIVLGWIDGLWPPKDDAAPGVPALRARQVAALSRQVPVLALPNLIGAWLTVFAYRDAAPFGFLLAWATAVTVAALPPLASWWRHRDRPLPGYVPRRVLLRSIAGTTLAGALWGAAGGVLFDHGGPEHRAFLIFMVAGMSAGAVAALSVQPTICFAFIVPLLVPLVLRFALDGGSLSPLMALMGALYLTALVVFVRNGYRGFVAGVELNLERDTLRGALRGIEARLTDAVESLRDGFALHDARDRLVLCNAKYRRLFGTLVEFGDAGRSYEQDLRQALEAGCVTLDGDADDWLRGRLARRRNAPSSEELRLADGRWLLVTETRTAASGTVALYTDISELKAREMALDASRLIATKAREEAEVASRSKSEFLANMSHELRTPLNAIIGFSQIALADTSDQLPPSTYRDYAKDVLESARHLLSIINSILDFAKVEVGKMPLDETTVSLAEEVGFVHRMLAEGAAERGVAIALGDLGPLPLIKGDPRMLRQALLNLLSNAVKFTPEGGRIEVSGRWSPATGISLTIADTGIGMTPEDIPRALAPFTQIDSSLSRRYEGTGLGLPLAKSMIELHGGRLELASEPGRGTTVTITLPPERVLS
jgi:signal transduction histidine kinase